MSADDENGGVGVGDEVVRNRAEGGAADEASASGGDDDHLGIERVGEVGQRFAGAAFAEDPELGGGGDLF